jgi:uncharacterized protein YggU (UPF0235/DUF167 family)
LRLLRGETARVKQIEVEGLDEAEAIERLGGPAGRL